MRIRLSGADLINYCVQAIMRKLCVAIAFALRLSYSDGTDVLKTSLAKHIKPLSLSKRHLLCIRYARINPRWLKTAAACIPNNYKSTNIFVDCVREVLLYRKQIRI